MRGRVRRPQRRGVALFQPADLAARRDRKRPSPGTTGEPLQPAAEGVAEIMLPGLRPRRRDAPCRPNRAAAVQTWVSPPPGPTGFSLPPSGARAPMRSFAPPTSPGAQLHRGAVADQLAAPPGVFFREQRCKRHIDRRRIAIENLAVREAEPSTPPSACARGRAPSGSIAATIDTLEQAQRLQQHLGPCDHGPELVHREPVIVEATAAWLDARRVARKVFAASRPAMGASPGRVPSARHDRNGRSPSATKTWRRLARGTRACRSAVAARPLRLRRECAGRVRRSPGVRNGLSDAAPCRSRATPRRSSAIRSGSSRPPE
jgi:hypothetical protein